MIKARIGLSVSADVEIPCGYEESRSGRAGHRDDKEQPVSPPPFMGADVGGDWAGALPREERSADGEECGGCWP